MAVPDRTKMQVTADQSSLTSTDAGMPAQLQPESFGFQQLFTYAKAFDWVLIVLGSIGGLVAGAPLPVCAFLFGNVLDKAHLSMSDLSVQERRMSETAFHSLIAGLIAAAAYFLQVACWMNIGERQAERIRYRYLQALLRQDLSFYDQDVTTGAVLESITVDTFHIKQATGEKVGKLVQVLGTLLSGYIIAFTQGWALTLITTATIPFILVSGYAMNLIVSKVSRDVSAANGKAGCIIEQVITAIKTVMPFGGEDKAVQAYDNALKNVARARLHQSIASGTGMGLISFCTFGMYAFALWMGALFIVHGDYSGGRVMTVLFSLVIATGALGQCIPSLTAIAVGTSAAHKMFRIIVRVPAVDVADERGLVLDKIRGEVEFENVHFAYPTRPEYQVFMDFSFRVPERAIAALVGESGSGKSTVVSLIERFYDPQRGQVKIDGEDLKGLRLSWFRQQVGLVSQEPVLLHGTVRDNIAWGKEHASDKEIVAAAEVANALEFIKSLPYGMETMVGQGGMQLSGGQKQRIAIARALLKNPRILLLDEATSALDAESEALVISALEGTMQGRTTLIIAHRLTTIKGADFIAVLQKGRVVEKGTRAELLRKAEGVFAELVRLEERRISGQDYNAGEAKQVPQPFMRPCLTCPNCKCSRSSLSETAGRKTNFQQDPTFEQNVRFFEIDQPSPALASSISCSHVLRLASLNKPETPFLLVGSLTAVINGATLPIIGFLFTKVIETFYKAPHTIRSSALVWIYVFVGFAVLALFLTPLQNVCFSLAGERLVRRIRRLVFNKILHQPVQWFEQSENSSGLISSQVQQDASQMRVVAGDGLSTIVQNSTTVFVGLFIAISTCWQLALLFLALLPFYSLDAYMQMKLGDTFDTKVKSAYAETSQIAHDALSSIRTVASFCAEKKILSTYSAKSLECLAGVRRQAFVGGIGFGVTYIMMFGSLALSFWAGGKLISSGQVDFDRFVKTFLVVELSACAVAISLGVAPDISNVKSAVASIFKLLDMKHNDLNAGIRLTQLKGEVKFQQVWFTYPSRPEAQIFSSLSFTLQAGKTLAVVGQSGCGKSTVLALVQRFYDPDEGTILLDNEDIRRLQVKWLRQQMGLVSQEPSLFNDTIRANIMYGVEGEVTEEALVAAAEAANAAKFIAGLPEGYESVVGERGVQLSGGQKQRVAIARAMVRDPKILLLDEATSALDAEAEVAVQEALERAAAGRSTMVVAHRLSTVRHADLIVVLKDCCVAEQGTHEQLMAIPSGIYASLVKLSTASP